VVHAFLEIHNHKNKFKIITEQQVMLDRKEIYMRRGANACVILPVLYMGWDCSSDKVNMQ
jgi:hypothetical protein